MRSEANKQRTNAMAAIVGSSALLERIKNTKLINLYDRETSISASTLWANQPVFVHVVRRPGCKLCRVSSHVILISVEPSTGLELATTRV